MSDNEKISEAQYLIAGMISTSPRFEELHPSAAVPLARQIVDAIAAGKIPGVAIDHDDALGCAIAERDGARLGSQLLTEDLAAANAKSAELAGLLREASMALMPMQYANLPEIERQRAFHMRARIDTALSGKVAP